MNMIRALLLFAGLFVFTNAYALKTKQDQHAALGAFIAELKTHYGMIKFKNKMFGTDLDALNRKYSRLIHQAITLEEDLGWDAPVKRDILPPEEFRQLLIGMIAELKDGHANTSRQTEDAFTLGLTAVSVGEKLIVTGLRRELMLPNSSMMDIKPGDEIVEVDGLSVLEHAKRNLIYMQGGTFNDRFQTAMITIVNNFATLQRPKSEGTPAVIKLRRDGKEFTAHLRWVSRNDYNLLLARFQIPDPSMNMYFEDVPVPYGVRGTVRSYFKTGLLATPEAAGLIDVGASLNREITLNKQETEKKIKAEVQEELVHPALNGLQPISRLQLYMVRHKGKNVGVLRIPSYSPGGMAQVKAEYLWLVQGLKKMENLVDVLVIDQLSNTGGYVYYGSRLLSLFANGQEPLQTVLADYKLNQTVLANLQPSLARDPVDNTSPVHAYLKLYGRYYDELKQRFENGEEWTGLGPSFDLSLPQFVEKPGQIFPAKEGVFTKPILLLNDQMSGSGGDFFPAQMQNNKRAIVKGDTSSGLGGPVYRNIASMPGSEMSFRCTYGYCELPDGWPIENIGVVPDLYREVRTEDLKDGFKAYATEVLDDAVALVDGGQRPAKSEAPKVEYIGIPEVLKEDLILRTLFDRLEVVARLKEMRELPRWKKNGDTLALINQLIAKGESAAPGSRFANPCEIRLGMTPLK